MYTDGNGQGGRTGAALLDLANGVKILMLGNPAFGVAVKAIYDCLKHLKDGGAIEDMADQQAAAHLLQVVNRTEEFVRWQQAFLRS